MQLAKTDEGFTLVEVVVALFLVALIALAFTPVVTNSLNLSSSNVSISTATQLVSKELDLVRGVPENCRAVTEQGDSPLGVLWKDPRGNVLEIHRSAQADCPTLYPGLMNYTVYVTRQGDSTVLSEATAKVYVSSFDEGTP